MTLPNWPVQKISRRKETVTARGICYSDDYQEGDLAQSLNLSARRWPYIATRNRREKLTDYDDATALTAWNGLVVVQGTDLLYDGQVVGTVTEGPKQFAAVNTRLVIWPDKVYLDMTTLTVQQLAATAEANAIEISKGEKNYEIAFTGAPDLTELFRPGDAVTLGGFKTLTADNRTFLIKELTADTIVTKTTIDNKEIQTGTETAETGEKLTAKREVPNLDYICESGNRLWGVSNEDKTVYASALGDPTNFYIYEGVSTDSFAMPVATEGDFTGCCKLTSSVLFWKEHVLHRVMGDYPAEYVMRTTEMEGLRTGCHKSMTVINDALFYVGLHGVFTYAGGTPVDISRVFGNHVITDAVGGTDGEKYYLSALVDGEKGLFVFDPNLGVWLREDGFRFTDIARQGDRVYLLNENGTVWLADAGEPDEHLDWEMEYKPFYEAIEGRKRASRLLIRLELPEGAWMRAETAVDEEKWQDAGLVRGPKTDAVPLLIQAGRGDRYKVRLRGRGPCVIKGVLREYLQGGYQ